VQLRLLEEHDIPVIADAFRAIGWDTRRSQYQRYLAEQQAGRRLVLVAFTDGAFSGYLTINWDSDYPPFRAEAIPEIQDFNVLPAARCRGIGTRLMDEAERIVATHSPRVGIGVGLDPDYGPAQRLYVRRGYIPDGRGATSGGQFVKYGDRVTVDDGLVLHLVKGLAPPAKITSE
jgi:GNAT superfamily N-acetyltransferase